MILTLYCNIRPIVPVYGCFDRVKGAFTVVELMTVRLPLLMKGSSSFLMTPDKVKNIGKFYHFKCLGEGKNKRSQQEI